MSIDANFLLLAGLVVVIVWFFIDFIRYVNTRSEMTQSEHEKLIFGRNLSTESRRLIYYVANELRPLTSAYRFWIVFLILVLMVLINFYFN